MPVLLLTLAVAFYYASYVCILRNEGYVKSVLGRTFFIQRVKAFITDMFLLNMPLMYITTYLVLDGRESLWGNQLAIFTCNIMYAILSSVFFSVSSQTPGYRYSEIALVKLDGSKPGFFRSLTFFILFAVEVASVVGMVVMIINKSGRSLHEIASGTKIVHRENKSRAPGRAPTPV